MSQPRALAALSDLTVEATDVIGTIASEWAALAAATGNVFATPDWAEVWLGTIGRGASVRIVVGRDAGGGLRLVLPLVLWRRGPLRIARFIGHGVADLQGPISAPSDGPPGRESLERVMATVLGDCDVFVGERMPLALGWAQMAGMTILNREANPTLDLTQWASWDEYLASRSRRLRRELGHDERVLAAGHALDIRVTSDPVELERDLDTLFALHRARFGPRSSFAPREAFHRRFASQALARGWLRLWILEADGQAAAARYDFSYGGVYHAYNGGRHPDWSKHSVGLVLRKHSLQAAFAEGASAYRFLRGGESYKGRFGTVDDPLVTVATSATRLGSTAVGIAKRLRRSPLLRGILRVRL